MSNFQISAPNIHLSLIILTCERLHHDDQFSCVDTHCIQTKTTGLKKKDTSILSVDFQPKQSDP